MCLLDYFIGVRLSRILCNFTSERNTLKCACCFCRLSRYSLPEVNFSFSCLKSSGIKLSPSIELNFHMKNWDFFFFFLFSSHLASNLSCHEAQLVFIGLITVVHHVHLTALKQIVHCREVFVVGDILQFLIFLCCVKQPPLSVLTKEIDWGENS